MLFIVLSLQRTIRFSRALFVFDIVLRNCVHFFLPRFDLALQFQNELIFFIIVLLFLLIKGSFIFLFNLLLNLKWFFLQDIWPIDVSLRFWGKLNSGLLMLFRNCFCLSIISGWKFTIFPLTIFILFTVLFIKNWVLVGLKKRSFSKVKFTHFLKWWCVETLEGSKFNRLLILSAYLFFLTSWSQLLFVWFNGFWFDDYIFFIIINWRLNCERCISICLSARRFDFFSKVGPALDLAVLIRVA